MSEGLTRRLQAILAADVVGYSRLMGRDEEGTLARLQALERGAVDPAIAAHGGEIVKRLGDGLLAVFPSAVAALRAARALRQQVAQQQADEAVPILYRVGLNVGDVIVTEDDIFGDGVNIAARIEGLADPGGIALSAAVYDNVRAQDPGPFDDLGEREVKNIEHPIRAYRVRFEDSPSLAPAAGAAARPWLVIAGVALGLGLLSLAWFLWPSPEPEAVDAVPAPVAPAPVAEPPTVAPPPEIATSRMGYPEPEPTPAKPVPEAPAAPAGADEPNLGEKLIDSIAGAIEEELAPGGSADKRKVPPGQAKKEKWK